MGGGGSEGEGSEGEGGGLLDSLKGPYRQAESERS